MQNLIERALCKSHVKIAMKLKFYSYIGIGHYLSICQNFSARGHPKGAWPPNVHLGPPQCLGNYYSYKVEIKNTIRGGKVLALGTKYFSLGGIPGGAGPPNVNLWPPNISETTRVRKLTLQTPLDMVKYPLWVQKKFPQASIERRGPLM